MAIELIGPDGRQYTIDDPANLAKAKALGYREVTSDEPQTTGEALREGASDVGEALQAGAAGALEGVAPGLVGTALAKPSGEETPTEKKVREYDRTELERLRNENPIASGVGNLAGAIVSPLNKIAAPLEAALGATSTAGRLAAKAVSNAPIGTLFGAGNALDDATLGDHQLTAEKLIAGSGLGTLLGGAGGLLGGALEEGAAAAAPLLKKGFERSKGALSEFADNRWMKAGGATMSDVQKIPQAERAAVEEEIRKAMTGKGVLPETMEDAQKNIATEREATAKTLLRSAGLGDAGGLTPQMNQEEALEAVGKALEENGNRITRVLKAADAAGATPSYADTLARFDTFEQGLNLAEKDLIAGDLKKVRGYLTDMGSQPVGSPQNNFSALNSIKSTLQKDTNWTADGAARFGLKRELAGILRDEIDTQLAPQVGSDLSKEFLEAKETYGSLRNAEKVLTKKSATGADAIRALVEDASLAQPSLAGKLTALDRATKITQHGVDRKLGNRFISPSDYLTALGGAVLTGGPGGALLGLGSAIGHKILREHGSAMIAKLVDHISASPQLGIAAAGFVNKLKSAAPLMGTSVQPVINAASQSAAHALATHMVMAQTSPEYAAAAQAAGFQPETPQQETHSLEKAHSLASLVATNQAHDETVGRAVAKVAKGERAPVASTVLSTQDFGAKRMRRDASDSHDQRVTEIRQLAADPQALLDRVTANIGHLSGMAPGISGAITGLAHAAVSYLAAQSTTPPKAGPLAPEWTTTEAERHAFKAKLETVQDPMSVLKHAASGTLTPDRMRALRAVYPRLAQQFADAALEQMISHPKAVPYRARLMLGMLSGSDPDGSIRQLASNQAAIHAQSSKPSNAGAPQGAGGAKALNVASRAALPAERKALED